MFAKFWQNHFKKFREIQKNFVLISSNFVFCEITKNHIMTSDHPTQEEDPLSWPVLKCKWRFTSCMYLNVAVIRLYETAWRLWNAIYGVLYRSNFLRCKTFWIFSETFIRSIIFSNMYDNMKKLLKVNNRVRYSKVFVLTVPHNQWKSVLSVFFSLSISPTYFAHELSLFGASFVR